MSIAKTKVNLDAELKRLEAEHLRLRSEDFIANVKGQMDASECDARNTARVYEIERYKEDGEVYLAEIEAKKRREALAAKRKRNHKYSSAPMRTFPYYEDFCPTKAQRAILVAFMSAAKGKAVFEVAHEWVVKKSGTSRPTVKRLINALVAHGLLKKQERRITGKAMNRKNLYTITCKALLKWAKSFIIFKGVKSESHPQEGDNTCTTEDKTRSLKVVQPIDDECRQKARRNSEKNSPEELEAETFDLVARGAMEELGHPLPDQCDRNEICKAILELKTTKQPDYKEFIWRQGVRRHGLRRALIAFLEVHVLAQVRRTSIPDDRPWNEREVIKNPNGYLYGILNRERGQCHPEITLGGILEERQIYPLPLNLTRAVKTRAKHKAKAMGRGNY